MRADLLALTADDLASFSNRGLVRRAEQEAASAGLTCKIDETPAGDVTARWSDNVECRLPAKARLSDSRCSCPATTLCRHVLRTVFAYQKFHHATPSVPPSAAPSTFSTPAATPSPSNVAAATPAAPVGSGPWNPGSLSDAQVAAHFSENELGRWKREYVSGHVIQVWTGTKPRAVLHTLGCAVTFRVPHDLRYAGCDCAAEAPCGHVALAVWAFRQLGAGQSTALISTGETPPVVPTELADDIERELMELVRTGLARVPALQVDRWKRYADRAAETGLIWPAEVLREISELHAAYLAHDARFNPRDFTALVAELLQRLDAIRAGRTPVPALFVRGSPHDREIEFGSARLIGVGCTVCVRGRGVEIAAHLQDCDSGTTVAVSRAFPDPPKDAKPPAPPRPFAELARAMAVKGATFAALGRGQLLIKGGRRTPSGRFVPGRAPSTVSPQAFAWEQLRAPLRVSSFAELREQLRNAPPLALGSRQMASQLTVCPLRAATDAEFSSARQQFTATLNDPQGDTALLASPFLSRGAAGAEKLLTTLRRLPNDVRFICAQAQLAGTQLILSPISVVWDENGHRTCVQRWVDDAPAATSRSDAVVQPEAEIAIDPLQDYLEELLDRVSETWLTGVSSTLASWPRLKELGTSLGFRRLAALDGLDAATRVLELTVLVDFAYREFSRLAAPSIK